MRPAPAPPRPQRTSAASARACRRRPASCARRCARSRRACRCGAAPAHARLRAARPSAALVPICMPTDSSLQRRPSHPHSRFIYSFLSDPQDKVSDMGRLEDRVDAKMAAVAGLEGQVAALGVGGAAAEQRLAELRHDLQVGVAVWGPRGVGAGLAHTGDPIPWAREPGVSLDLPFAAGSRRRRQQPAAERTRGVRIRLAASVQALAGQLAKAEKGAAVAALEAQRAGLTALQRGQVRGRPRVGAAAQGARWAPKVFEAQGRAGQYQPLPPPIPSGRRTRGGGHPRRRAGPHRVRAAVPRASHDRRGATAGWLLWLLGRTGCLRQPRPWARKAASPPLGRAPVEPPSLRAGARGALLRAAPGDLPAGRAAGGRPGAPCARGGRGAVRGRGRVQPGEKGKGGELLRGRAQFGVGLA
jgi:hypothetical protein